MSVFDSGLSTFNVTLSRTAVLISGNQYDQYYNAVK